MINTFLQVAKYLIFGAMNKPLYHFFTEDHHRIETYLQKATGQAGKIEMDS